VKIGGKYNYETHSVLINSTAGIDMLLYKIKFSLLLPDF